MDKSELQHIADLRNARERIASELGKVIINQERVVEEMLIALFAGGHCLLVGVPGLAKTLLVSSIAKVLDLKFTRIQFTPDLMPSDITGAEILHEDPVTKSRVFKFVKGPIFSNIVLADEINRTPPKTQAALLQAMQEYEVTAAGETYKLGLPFFVLATQNPIELEGTYPLPEAQLDRFMFMALCEPRYGNLAVLHCGFHWSRYLQPTADAVITSILEAEGRDRIERKQTRALHNLVEAHLDQTTLERSSIAGCISIFSLAQMLLSKSCRAGIV